MINLHLFVRMKTFTWITCYYSCYFEIAVKAVIQSCTVTWDANTFEINVWISGIIWCQVIYMGIRIFENECSRRFDAALCLHSSVSSIIPFRSLWTVRMARKYCVITSQPFKPCFVIVFWFQQNWLYGLEKIKLSCIFLEWNLLFYIMD